MPLCVLFRRVGSILLLGTLLLQLPGIRNHHYWKQKHVGASEHRGLSSPQYAADGGGPMSRLYPDQATENPIDGEEQEVVTVDEDSQTSAAQTGEDPFDDDDGKLNRGRAKYPVATTSTSVSKPSKDLPVSEFLSVLRDHLLVQRQHQLDRTSLLSHFGSGPCHSLPRPREQTASPLC